MIILEKPYVSEFLVETIKRNGFSVLNNEVSKLFFSEERLLNKIPLNEKYIYSNSENSISQVLDGMPESELARMIKISKDKFLFRKHLASIYPNYFFEKIAINELKNINIENIKFPCVLKPCVGFLSFGVYTIQNREEFLQVLKNLDNDIEKFKNIFPSNVVDTAEFLIEEMIDGEEYAIDGYFNENGEAVILNIFQHPFFDSKDVSDRVYYTSKTIIKDNLKQFKDILDKIGQACCYKSFPFHLELRKNKFGIVPIELNPMRFCGWCITDIANWAWNINVYEYFFNQLKPNWDEILQNVDDDYYYYFTIGDIPANIIRSEIKKIDYQSFLSNIKNPLEIRKIDYKLNPIFVIVFAKTSDLTEIKNILKLDMQKFIKK